MISEGGGADKENDKVINGRGKLENPPSSQNILLE